MKFLQHHPSIKFIFHILHLLVGQHDLSSKKISELSNDVIPIDLSLIKAYLNSSLGVDSPYTYVIKAGSSLNCAGNFLASQVWPSSRFAATSVQKFIRSLPIHAVCELGCGPGLPSITIASMNKQGATSHQNEIRVICTDIDPFALELVSRAASEQEVSSMIQTQIFDLVSKEALPEADLYLMSDVFETKSVALGSAYHVSKALMSDKFVWVFAQSDRIQREVFLEELSRLMNKSLRWSRKFPIEGNEKLWLCDVDELDVTY